MIMDDWATQNAGGLTFAELHGVTCADMDGDGIPDFITGRRFISEDDVVDPDPWGASVLYVCYTVRDKSAPGGAVRGPELRWTSSLPPTAVSSFSGASHIQLAQEQRNSSHGGAPTSGAWWR
jgi:hypothetical protein